MERPSLEGHDRVAESLCARQGLAARHLARVLALSVVSVVPSWAGGVSDRIDWPAFLGRHDLVWKRPPDRWESGAFSGNGLLGANAYATEDGRSFLWRIGRTDVVDRGMRIPIGDLVLRTKGNLAGADLRLDLWNAELSGTLATSQGRIGVRSFTHAEQHLQWIELSPSGGEAVMGFEWLAGLAANPRFAHLKQAVPEDERNPGPRIESEGATTLALQPLKLGGGHVTAWRVTSGGKGVKLVLLSVGYSRTDLAAARSEAEAALEKASAAGPARLVRSHRRWWHRFWPASFLSIPDTRLESFYWIQIYKMASGTRADRPMLDLMGPWFRSTPWPRIWWNLNAQLTYWLQLASNRLELGESLLRTLDAGKEQLARNAGPFSADSYALGRSSSYDLDRPVAHELCPLPWVLHNYYLQYRYSMDPQVLRRLFPLLKGSTNYYLHLLKEGPDGFLHVSDGYSPEYPAQPTPNPDCSIDLALLRWACRTLIESSEELKLDDPLVPTWKRTLERLVPYPVDENGFKVSASVPFAVSHRHYSHLMMVYPLYLTNVDQPENRELVMKSLNHWMGLKTALRGYSFTGAASISALMGRGDDAKDYLDAMLEKWIHPNTLYTEAGPVIETPLSAAVSLHDMLLASWGGKIRLFPAVPKAWGDISFHDLRGEGAFLVSAVRRGGVTRFIRVRSLAGGPCRLVTDLLDPKGAHAKVEKVAEGEYTVTLKKGESVVLTAGGAKADLTIAPVASEKGRENYYGLH